MSPTAAAGHSAHPVQPAVKPRGLVISCEHGGREVPADFSHLFGGHEALLDSHRGWDPGALQLGAQMADALGAPFFGATTTRLLVDLNRSVGHKQLFSEATRGLSRAARLALVAAHYRPHRDAVEGEIDRRIAAGQAVTHIATHSFTPVLAGVVRRADVAWLYDPRRPGEAALAQHWLDALARLAPGLRLRRNYPYQGREDGLSSWLRKRHAAPSYVGLEVEVNQQIVQHGGAAWDRLRAQLIDSLATALLHSPG